MGCRISSVAYVPNLTVTGNSSAFWSGPAKTEAPMSGTNLGKTENQSEHQPPHAGLGLGVSQPPHAGLELGVSSGDRQGTLSSQSSWN